MSNGRLPSFRKPPVIETALNVEFARLDGLQIPHFGLFWNSVRGAFPKSETHPPLISRVEKFGKPVGFQVEFRDTPDVRCWFVSDDERQLIQVQPDQFTYNWRKRSAEDEYPRYDDFIRPAFESNWTRFNEFLVAEQLGTPKVVQCEIAYISHIPKGQGWNQVSDWNKVFRMLEGSSTHFEFLGQPEGAGFNVNYLLPDTRGRLRISAKQAVQQSDGMEVIVLNLVARGRPASSSTQDVLEFLDLCREWVVRGFAEITTDEMHKAWERET